MNSTILLINPLIIWQP